MRSPQRKRTGRHLPVVLEGRGIPQPRPSAPSGSSVMRRAPETLDPDLQAKVTASGRIGFVGAVGTVVGAGGIVGIDMLYRGEPTILAWVAVAVIISAIPAGGLVLLALLTRSEWSTWARREMNRRLARRANRDLRATDEDLEDEV